MKIGDRVFVVTGGGNGVGRELVLQLLSCGARAAAVDIDEKGLEETARRAGKDRDRLSAHLVNIADAEAVQSLPGQVIALHGRIDGVINNAGIVHPFAEVNDIGYDTIRRVMDVNFGGTLNMTKAFLPRLLARPEAFIVNVSSMGALFSVPGQGVYGASKAAVKLITESLCGELRGTGVRVLAVYPGGINTDLLGHSGVETSRRMERLRKIVKLPTPQSVAKIIINGIKRNRVRLTPGLDAMLIDFCCRMSPVCAPRLIYRIMKWIVLE